MNWLRPLAELVTQRTGISLADRQLFHGVRRFVEQRVEELGLEGPEQYVRSLATTRDNTAEFAKLTQAVTVGYSYFFRDVDQLNAVVEVLRGCTRERGTANVWIAACSTGQEAWSLAILCELAKLDVHILATDLNGFAVDTAQTARYGEATLDRVPVRLRAGFEACAQGGVQVREPIRRRVRFKKHNLVGTGPYPHAHQGARFDIILCRNAFIYFGEPVQVQIASRFANSLTSDGWLFLGPSETLDQGAVPLVAETVARRVGYRNRHAPVSIPPREPTPAPRKRPKVEDLNRAIALAKAGNLAHAERVLQGLCTRVDSSDSWMALGNIRLKRHDFCGAIEAYTQAKGRDGLRADLHYALGVVYRKQGDLAAAEEALRRALFLAPAHWASAWLLAGVYRRQGRPRDQRIALSRARAALQDGAKTTISDVPHFGVEALAIAPEDVGELR